MRLFDIIGAAAVATWVGIVGMFVYDLNFQGDTKDLGASVIFHEGESWMILTRESEEVGYIHESRTELDRGNWLLEYDLLMNVSMLGVDQYLRTQIRANVDANAHLDKFSADIRTGGTTFDLRGRVEGSAVIMSMDLAGREREQRIELNEPPRLANSALNQLVARDSLEPGMRFEQEYFDPTVMGMTKMTFEYVREHDVEVYGEKIPTLHFRQLVAGTELDVYVDRNAEVYVQEFPLRILGARVPPALGRARARSVQRQFETETKHADPIDLSIETAVGLLKGTAAAGAAGTTRFRIEHLPVDVPLQLESMRQRVISRGETHAIIDTASRGQLPPPRRDQHAQYLETTLRVDSDDDAFGELAEEADSTSKTHLAEAIARAVRSRMKVVGKVGIQTASQALESGEGDCTEFALVLVAALRRHEVPARFVSGVKRDEDGNFIPHQWVQYFNDTSFVDLDPTMTTLRPGPDQIQFYTHAEPEKTDLAHLLGQIQIEPLADDPSDDPPLEGDFN